MNDADFLASVLADHRWHSWNEIMLRSQRERGHGLTIHSRAAQLRRQRNLNIECKTERRDGRAMSFYRLLDTATPQPSPDDADVILLPAPGVAVSSRPTSNPAQAPLAGADGEADNEGRDGAGLLVSEGQLSLLEVAA